MVKTTTKPVPAVKRKGLIGNLRKFRENPLNYMVACKAECGDTFTTDVVVRKLFVTSNPEFMRHVLQTNNKNYIKDISYRQLGLALGNGLLVNEGESWMRQRRLAQPAFYKKRLEGLFNTMVNTAERFFDNDFDKHCSNSDSFNITPEMNIVTSDIALDTLLGGNRYGENRDIQDTIKEAQQYIVRRIRYPHTIPWMHLNGTHRRFQNDIKRFDNAIYQVLADYRKSDEDDNHLLSMLLEARDEDTGETMSDQQLRDELITIYVAGHETSANALSWTWYALTQNPDVYQKLKDEVRTVLGNRRPTIEDLRALPYTRRVMEESMRMYPPAWAMGREALDEDEAVGYRIPKGQIIFLSIYNIHHDTGIWKDPQRFDPERFTPERVKARPRGVYMPFGLGPRMCIGNNFALMEIQLLIAMMVQRYDFELDENHLVEPEPMVTLRPKNGVKVRVKKVPQQFIVNGQ